MILSPDCRDGNSHKCPGTAWDETFDEPAVCQNPEHHPGYTPFMVRIAHVIADAKDKYAQVDRKGPNNMDLVAAEALAADLKHIAQTAMTDLFEGDGK
ncbi:hypothetical protein SEA_BEATUSCOMEDENTI_97 [Arthrobacter phage BeatusComedenti]|uniref:Uncharacterized protein n=1 Tax=Arthrobacter phage BeatusComedenti TaxID=2656523 RepID=A0A649VVL6_9CAUD|nr:hypothetical protein SEA_BEATUSCOMEDENTI_97 [Arthrobacter phage BeatusComedenti]